MSTNYDHLPAIIRTEGDQRKLANQKLVRTLKSRKPKTLDLEVQKAHEEVFENTDCLSCGNCCRTTSPVFTEHDIERISKRLRMRTSQFVSTYLHRDSDDDMVLNQSPCAFLQDDNACMIYEDRPLACRTYPHTDRKRFYQVLDLSYENSFICPAVQKIMEVLEKIYIKP